jgi:hypothetical protein
METLPLGGEGEQSWEVLEARLESDQRFEEIKKRGVRTRYSRGEC